MFGKWKKIDSWVKKVDKLVTWIIIWGAVAGLLWLSQTKKWKEITSSFSSKVWKVVTDSSKVWGGIVSSAWKKWIWWLWKFVAFMVSIFSKRK